MKILDSFIADDGEEKTKIELVQIRAFPKRYGYVVVRNSNFRDFLFPYLSMFFAKRRFNKLKEGYKSCWTIYSVYETGAGV